MKFKAHIKLTEEQRQDAIRYEFEDKEYHDIEFTLKDLAEHLFMLHETHVLPYDIREKLVPWLLGGNQPDIIFSDDVAKSAALVKEEQQNETQKIFHKGKTYTITTIR